MTWIFFLSEDSSDSTWGAYKKELLPLTGLSEEQFLQVRTELDCQQAAADYQGLNFCSFTCRLQVYKAVVFLMSSLLQILEAYISVLLNAHCCNISMSKDFLMVKTSHKIGFSAICCIKL